MILSVRWPVRKGRLAKQSPHAFVYPARRVHSSPIVLKDSKVKTSIRQQSPPPEWTVEQYAEARHLLRAILRECTYLPDPHARQYLASYALARFKDYTRHSKPAPILIERRDAKIKEARKSLSNLRTANSGDLKLITRVLDLTYGRIGKARRDLLQPLLVPDHPVHTNLSASVNEEGSTAPSLPSSTSGGKPSASVNEEGSTAPSLSPSTTHGKEAQPGKNDLPQLTQRLKVLLFSQIHVRPPDIGRSSPKLLTLQISDENTWGRPMPWKRVKNAHAEWYATVLDRVKPPLSVTAWEELKQRAAGIIQYEPVKRRTRLASERPEKCASPLESQLGLRAIKTPQDVLKHVDERLRPRAITRRYMQRRWADVFARCPKLEWNHERKKWEVLWGCEVLSSLNRDRATVLEKTVPASSRAAPSVPDKSS